MPDQTMKTGDEYVKESRYCPRCGSSNIEPGAISVGVDIAWREIGCLDCDLAYQDTYTLTRYKTELPGEGYREYNSNLARLPVLR